MTLTKSLFLCAALLACSDSKAPSAPESGPFVFGGVAVQAASPPPPVVGGTVRIGSAGGMPYAVVSDPDEDAIDVVVLGPTPTLVGSIALSPGDEPNRIVFDASGLAHVILRRGGAVVTIDPRTAKLIARRDVCPAPRGIDYDTRGDLLYVACADGQLVTLSKTGVTRVVQLDRDLRDVIVSTDHLTVTRFRSAERLRVDATGAIVSREEPGSPAGMAPDVAWRTRLDQQGRAVMLHQLASTQALVVVPQQSYYATATGAISASAISIEVSASEATPLAVTQSIDFALDAQDDVEALSVGGEIQIGPTKLVALGPGTYYGPGDYSYQFIGIDDGGASGIPFKVVQRRAPTAELEIFGATFDASVASIALPQTTSHLDTGFDIFHVPTSVGAACMTCHPEGGDDGRTWRFAFKDHNEARRTPSLRGGVITGTAPYHWSGDLSDFEALCAEVFTHRMGGAQINGTQRSIFARWLGAVPRVPLTPVDTQSAARGQAIFVGSGGCASCHVGGTGTRADNQDIGKTDVLGASSPTQVPSLLGVVDRAPYMHDGCAATLMDRFTNVECGGSKHGTTTQLGAGDLADLTTYLGSL